MQFSSSAPAAAAAAAAATLTFSSSFLLVQELRTKPFFFSFLTSRPPKTLAPICGAESKPRPPKAPRRRKASYGASRRSAIKKSFSQEQIHFTSPVSADPAVAIIGGGVSGLVCALHLDARCIRSTVFDTGVHGLGGRMGTRIIDPRPLIFDHAAQFFTVSDSRFGKLVDGWLERGLVQEWSGMIGELEEGGNFKLIPPSAPRLWCTGINRFHSAVIESNFSFYCFKYWTIYTIYTSNSSVQ